MANIVRATGLLLSAVACLWSTSPTAAAAELAGTWSGTGSVVLINGKAEKARCRVTFSPYGPRSFSMSAVCATAGARVEQTAKVRRVGSNTYAGSFRNTEYNVSGTINLAVRGSKISASLSGGGAAAHMSLSR
ncbi:MAG: hypothetical protein NW217_01645 [Hyphomicrobiaceae bacterium]|nr:hypothetical protein [Hyphomicrobiaceae bacterium]